MPYEGTMVIKESTVSESTKELRDLGNGPVGERILSALQRLSHRLDRIEQVLEPQELLASALRTYKDQVESEAKSEDELRFLGLWWSRLSADTSLRPAHRRILDYLSQQYDRGGQGFQEIPVSKLVREAGVAKHRSGEYLGLLEELGYVEQRAEGRRRWFRLARPGDDERGTLRKSSA